MGEHKSLREESRGNWRIGEDRALNNEEIKLGALLRIADATEVMAQRHRELIDENKNLRDSVAYYRQKLVFECRSAAALKGVITKLKHERSE